MTPLEPSLARLNRASRRLLPRRFHAYCVGAAKTGTTSVAAMFGKAYRATHEPEAEETNHLVIEYLEGAFDQERLRTLLVERDQRLRLEMEAAHPLGYLAGALAGAFPQARFVVTIREPRAWLRSRLNFHHKNDPPAWREYREYFWTRRHRGFAADEAPLARMGLCSLDTYLQQYTDHYRRVLTEIPSDRRMIVRTSELGQRLKEVARFVGADPAGLTPAHSKRSHHEIDPLSEMDDDFVRDRISHHCTDMIREFFPETLDPREG